LDNGESVIKIFSPKRLDEEFLDALFLNRSWTFHKGWHAFPELDPVTKESDFPSCILKTNEQDASGIVYTGAFENFISVSIYAIFPCYFIHIH
jgi:prenylcysteine oxidase/farnesylcysteine lyase